MRNTVFDIVTTSSLIGFADLFRVRKRERSNKGKGNVVRIADTEIDNTNGTLQEGTVSLLYPQ